MNIILLFPLTTLFFSLLHKGNPGTPGQLGAKGEPGESLSAPEVTVSSTSDTVTENQTATFYCSANGNPTPTVTWSRTGVTKPIASPHNKLEITKAVYNDSGNYVCTASSILGEVQKQVKLVVEGKHILENRVCYMKMTLMSLSLISYLT